MPFIERKILPELKARLTPNRAVILYGARRVGKTMLLREIAKNYDGNVLMLSGEDADTATLIADRSVANYKRLLSGVDLFIIDEAQNIPDIGRKLKLMVDEVEGVRIIASGSSSFELNNQVGEPLVGRATKFMLLPFAQSELSATENLIETRRNLETRLLFGSYPDVVLMPDDKLRAEYLKDLVDAYLLKDILTLDGVKNSAKMLSLLRLVAFQVGSEISYDEIGKQIGLSRNTVEKYMDLLSKVFVIFRIGGFARNLRKEVAKAGKWYFHDVGVRNAVIGNFSPLALRQDTGALWENYLIAERVKRSNNLRLMHDFHFWKTYDHQEIDLVEAAPDMSLEAFEIKWGDKTPKCPVAFAGAYPDAPFTILNRDNYLDFID